MKVWDGELQCQEQWKFITSEAFKACQMGFCYSSWCYFLGSKTSKATSTAVEGLCL